MSLRRALVMAASGRFLVVPLQMIGPIIIARLLTPADFGLFGIAVSVLGVSASLRELGATSYLIRLPVLDRIALGRALAFTGTMSLSLGVAVFLLRGQIGAFFGDARIADLVGILSLNFVLVPPTIGAFANLQRQLRFGLMNVIQIGTVAVALVVQIGLALAGFGPFALALGQMAQSAAMLLWLAVVEPGAVLVRPVFSGLGEMMRFGVFSALSGLVGQVGNYATSLILGRRLGPAAVGYFERGTGLTLSLGDIIVAIAQVLFVGIAKVRDDRVALAELMMNALANLTALVWPGYLLVAALAEPIIVVLFGARWAPSAPVLQIFCLVGLLSSGTIIYQRMVIAMGNTRRLFVIEVATQGSRFAAVLALSGFGFVMAAWGTAISMVVGFALWVAAARTYLHASRTAVVAIYVRSLLIAVGTALPAWLLARGDPLGLGPFLLLPAGGAAAAASWLAIILLTRHSLAAELARAVTWAKALLRRAG